MQYLEAEMGPSSNPYDKRGVKYIGCAFPIFSYQNMSQFQYCLSIDPDHHKCVSNLHWIVMQMYKLKTEVQNNHGINFRLVGIMQDWWSKEADWQIVWFCQGGLTGRGPS